MLEKLVDPRLSDQISKLNAIEINQIKKFDSSSKPPNINVNINVATSSSLSSTSSSIKKIHDSSFQSPETNSLNNNFQIDSANVNDEKVINGTITKKQFSSDGQFKMNQVYGDERTDLSSIEG